MATDVSSPPRPELSPPSATTNSGTDPPTFESLDDWRGSATFFDGFTGTRPHKEVIDASWEEIAQTVCPEKPTQIEDKRQGMCFVPCQLKVAPLVGKTGETAQAKGEPTIGKMRSKQHMTKATFLVHDVDGESRQVVRQSTQELEKNNIAFQLYTTHSHGDPEKPGVRVRIIIPLNREVDDKEYEAAWHGIDQTYFDGQLAKADASGANMYQQQGTWCCHPDRVDRAKSKRHDAGLADANALILAGRAALPKSPDAPRITAKSVSDYSDFVSDFPEADADQIADRCPQIGKFRDEKGAGQGEPLWNSSVSIVAHCMDGNEKAQAWSSGHPGYSIL